MELLKIYLDSNNIQYDVKKRIMELVWSISMESYNLAKHK
jgi:hypothetical protein